MKIEKNIKFTINLRKKSFTNGFSKKLIKFAITIFGIRTLGNLFRQFDYKIQQSAF